MTIDFIQARHFTTPWPSQPRRVSLVVIHSAETPMRAGSARAVARYFEGPQAPKASAHYCVDPSEVVQCVRLEHEAWAAPGANMQGVHIELSGYAKFAEAVWLSEPGQAQLVLAAGVVRSVCDRFDIPVEFVDASDLMTRKPGITTHAEISRAWKRSDHWDPGPGFPMAFLLQSVHIARTS